MPVAYVGVGANLGAREDTIRAATHLIAEHPAITLLESSSLRETEPWGPVPQPLYLNGVLMVATQLSPRHLLDALLDIERQLGRSRFETEERYGPRAIDLDLLLFDGLELAEPGLELPHPRMHERAFVLEPLVELAPGLTVPGRGTVEELLAGIHSGP
jgi:2-amino-4-hydroxy-6-hydroxymethyldihydropteridine diphosphokinase